MENTVSEKQNSKLIKSECKFCKCKNYTRQRCMKGVNDSKLVKEDAEISREGDKAVIEETADQADEDKR